MSRNNDARVLDHAALDGSAHSELGRTLLELPGATESTTPAWREAAAITCDHEGPHISYETDDADTTVTVLGDGEAMLWIHSDDRRRITALATIATMALTPAALKIVSEMLEALGNLVS